jgi:hypothetical protein|tara:strand:- start:5030 stop:5593 length:564 start_codon:yes stop_codon:yes gene_type:complete
VAIKIKIDPDISEEEAAAASKPAPDARISLEVRKTLDGKIMILDHLHIDVIIDAVNKKITTFPKEELNDEAYGHQSSYFDFLSKQGIVLPETIQSGNVFGSLEVKYPDAIDEGVNAEQVILYSTKTFIDDTNPEIKKAEHIELDQEKHLLDPEPKDSTELGEVPQEPEKGSITPSRIRRYLAGYGYY